MEDACAEVAEELYDEAAMEMYSDIVMAEAAMAMHGKLSKEMKQTVAAMLSPFPHIYVYSSHFTWFSCLKGYEIIRRQLLKVHSTSLRKFICASVLHCCSDGLWSQAPAHR